MISIQEGPKMPATEDIEKSEAEKLKDRVENERIKYKEVIDAREKQYDLDVEQNPKMENIRPANEKHNNFVFKGAVELIDQLDLTPQEAAAAKIATLLHDAGKLGAPLPAHHEKGMEYAKNILDEMQKKGETLENVALTDTVYEKTNEAGEKTAVTVRDKVLQAIERHMNHGFLVRIFGDKFPKPEDIVDKIVFAADMIANATFKNVGFRVGNKDMLTEDLKKAEEQNIPLLQESFNNVLDGTPIVEGGDVKDGIRDLQNLDFIKDFPEAKVSIGKLKGDLEKIFNYMAEQNKFQEIQDNFTMDHLTLLGLEFTPEVITDPNNKTKIGDKEMPLSVALQIYIDSAIKEAGKAVNIDPDTVKDFTIQ